MRTIKQTNKQKSNKLPPALQPSSSLYLGNLACFGEQPHFAYPFSESPKILATLSKHLLKLRYTK